MQGKAVVTVVAWVVLLGSAALAGLAAAKEGVSFSWTEAFVTASLALLVARHLPGGIRDPQFQQRTTPRRRLFAIASTLILYGLLIVAALTDVFDPVLRAIGIFGSSALKFVTLGAFIFFAASLESYSSRGKLTRSA